MNLRVARASVLFAFFGVDVDVLSLRFALVEIENFLQKLLVLYRLQNLLVLVETENYDLVLGDVVVGFGGEQERVFFALVFGYVENTEFYDVVFLVDKFDNAFVKFLGLFV